MNNPDEVIGRVLAGLRAAQAPEGMERRILETVEARSVASAAAARRWAFRVAFASVIAACLFMVIALVLRHRNSSTEAQKHTIAPKPYLPVGPAAGEFACHHAGWSQGGCDC